MKRLFIPLCTEPFRWFKEGKKEWELRKISRKFNSDIIYIGETVELRRGYIAKNGVIWGKVTDCQTFISLKEVFSAIPYNRIVDAENEKQAMQYICKIMDIPSDDLSGFVAIRIEKIDTLGEIIFEDKFLPLIREGHKTSTIRNGIRHYFPGFYTAYNDTRTKCELLKVSGTELTKYGQLTDDNATKEGYEFVEELKVELLRYYPDLTNDSTMTIIYFEEE